MLTSYHTVKDKMQSTGPALLMGLGHGATHWIIATVYVVLPYLQKDFGLDVHASWFVDHALLGVKFGCQCGFRRDC